MRVAQGRDELIALEAIAKKKILELLNDRDPVLPELETATHEQASDQQQTSGHVVALEDIREEKRINVGVEDVFGAIYSQMDLKI